MLKPFNIVAGIFSSLFIGVFCYSCLYVLPNVEDFYLSVLPAKFGTYNFVRFFSATFTGRYTANFLDGVNPLVFGLWQYYPLYILISFFINLGATIWFIKTLLKTSFVEAVFVGVYVAALFLFITPSLFFSFYYFTFSFCYILPITFILINASLFILYIRKSNEKKFTLFLLLSLSLFVGIGMNEMALPFYFLLSLITLIWIGIKQKHQIKFVLPLSIIVFLSIGFFIGSPGSFARIDEGAINITFVLKNSVTLYFKALNKYLFLLPFLGIIGTSFIIRNKTPKISFGLSFLLWWLLPYAITLPYYIARPSTENIETRIYVPVVYLFWTIAALFILPAFWRFLDFKWKRVTSSKAFTTSIYTLSVIALGILSVQTLYGHSYNLGFILKDFENGKIQQFYQLNLRNFQKLQQAKQSNAKNEIVYIEESIEYPTSLFHKIHEEKNRYSSLWNLGLEGYFDVNEVRICGENQCKFSKR